jgi:hypothetical protein
MSAFIVEQTTINRIVTTIGLECHWTVFDDLAELGFGDDLQALGRAMLNLNVDAVNQRYNEHTNPLDLPYRFRPEPVTDIQAFKSLECWLYQCTEGNVPQQKLYQVLKAFRHTLANRIVETLPAYEQADWDAR